MLGLPPFAPGAGVFAPPSEVALAVRSPPRGGLGVGVGAVFRVGSVEFATASALALIACDVPRRLPTVASARKSGADVFALTAKGLDDLVVGPAPAPEREDLSFEGLAHSGPWVEAACVGGPAGQREEPSGSDAVSFRG
jgi:hypothetical protein